MTNIIFDTALTLWQTGRKIRRVSNGWLSGNAPCCIHNNQTADRRGRGGFICTDSKISYSCFNCGYKCSYSTGSTVSARFKDLLLWLGADQASVDRLVIEALRTREDELGVQSLLKKFNQPKFITFDTRPLPEGCQPLDVKNTEHCEQVKYLQSRGLDPLGYPYHVSPNAQGRDQHRIIIPYYYEGNTVGSTSRYYDSRKPKYISDQPRGYVFNLDAQGANWQACILVEGQFDAIAIGGCAYLGSTISDEQAHLLTRLRRKIIVVPDRDSTGLTVCERALELGYTISLPEWSYDIKDVNDAVKKYGRLATTLSILQNATTNKIKLEMMKRRYK